jgi:hypothetical protein
MRKNRKPILVYKGSVEGNQEKLYFDRLTDIINMEESSKYNVDFRLSSNRGGSPLQVANKADRTKTSKDDKIIAVFDYDNKEKDFVNALSFCEKKKIQIAYSNLSFELWLLFHKTYTTKTVKSSEQYDKIIRKLYNISESNIKEEKTIDKIMEKIILSDVIQAIKNSEILEKYNQDCGSVLFKSKVYHYEQPSLKIHECIKEVLIKCGLYN